MLTTDRCPVTGGAPTRMSETAFRSVCGKRRDGVWVDPGLGYAPFFSASKRCGECKGERANWPEELDIIETEELNMGKKTGVCDICGERKELKHAARGGGLDVCTSCWGLLTAAGKPELLAKAVRLADAEEALANALGGSAGGNAPDQARIEGELAQMREYADAAMGALADVLPHEDEGLDDTRSYADLPELAGRAARRIMVDAAQLDTLRDLLKPGEDETLVTAATSNAKAARAWAALMDRARDAGFGELAASRRIVEPLLADANTSFADLPEACRIMVDNVKNARNIIADHNKSRGTIAEQEKIIAELAEQLDRANVALPASDPVDDALLKWARERLENGDLSLRVEEAAA